MINPTHLPSPTRVDGNAERSGPRAAGLPIPGAVYLFHTLRQTQLSKLAPELALDEGRDPQGQPVAQQTGWESDWMGVRSGEE